MLTLKELRFHGIGRFVEEQQISFERLGSLIQIDGQNNNTKGSSGAGKSTIFHALEFLFGLNSIPNTVLQSRLTSESIFVEGTFDLDGQSLIISRGKKLKVTLAGEVTTGSSKLTEEKLDQILAIPRHLFRPMLHKVQGEKGFFLGFTPKETNDFLTDCLELGRFKQHLIKLDEKIQELTKKKETLTIGLESARAGLKASQDVLTSIGPLPMKEMDQETIIRLKTNAEASSAQLRTVLADQSKELQECERVWRPTTVVIPFDSSAKKKHENDLQDIRVQSNQLILLNKDKENKIQTAIYSAKTKLRGLEAMKEKGDSANELVAQHVAEIKKIRNSMCPKCEQPWATESAKKEEAQLLESICKMRAIILAAEEAASEIPNTHKEIEKLTNDMPPAVPEGFLEFRQKERDVKALIEEEVKKEYVHNDSVNSTNAGNQAIFIRKYNELKDKHAKDAEQQRGQASIDQRVFEAAVMKLRSYEETRIRHENSIRTLKAQEKEYSDKLVSLETELAQANLNLDFSEELKRAIKSYLSCSFDEALESISENATNLVRNVPNMTNATIQLVGFWETKDGKVKEEVNAVLHLDGDENIDIRSLCGGERTAIDLAVDLSAIELIENKANKGINIFILDEPFNGLDTVCIEMALEVLKNASAHKKLVIVDHNPEVKQMVESKLLVIRDGTTSKVVQN